MQSVIDMPDNLVMISCLKFIRGYKYPSINMSEEEKRVKAAMSRIELAEYYLNSLKVKIEKNKKVSEVEFKFRIEDLTRAQSALFQLGR